MTTHSIYCILDPTVVGTFVFGDLEFNCLPRYVGLSNNPKERILSHIRGSRPGLFNDANLKQKFLNWLVFFEKRQPEIAILEDNLSEQEAIAMEKYYIAKIGLLYDKSGPLLNLNLGGAGSSRKMVSKKTLRRRSKGLCRNWLAVKQDPLLYEQRKAAHRKAVLHKDWAESVEKRKITNNLKSAKEKSLVSAKSSKSRMRHLASISPEERSKRARKAIATLGPSGVRARALKVGAVLVGKAALAHKEVIAKTEYKFKLSSYVGSRKLAEYKCPVHGYFKRFPETVNLSIRSGNTPCSTCNIEAGNEKKRHLRG